MIRHIFYLITVVLFCVALSMLFIAIPWAMYAWAMPLVFPFGDPSWTQPPFLVFYVLSLLFLMVVYIIKK